MATSDFQVTVGADVAAYNAGLNQAVNTAATASTSITRSLGAAAQASVAMGGAVARGSNQAGMALTNLGRVAQDAPFGFIGIQNNLNPLLESFQRLRQETGSNIGALKALGSSLMGAGGIGLALSLVTSAITIYTMWQQRAHKGQKDLTDSTKSYVDTLDSVRAAQLKGAQQGANELIRVKLLYDATQNHALSLRDRNLAYNELEEKYPKWFSNAEREKTLLGQNTTGYNDLATAILAAANAKAYEQQIGENSNRALQDQYKINDALAQNVKLQSEADKAKAKSGSKLFITRLASGEVIELSQEAKVIGDIAKNTKLVNDLKTDQTKLFNQSQQLMKMATDAELAAGFKTGTQLDDKIKKLKEVNLLKRNEIDTPKDNRNLIGGIDSQLSPISNGDGGMPDLQARNERIKESTRQQDEYNASLKQGALIMGDIISLAGSGLTSAFQSVVSGTQSLVSAMGQFLGQLISKLVAAAAAAAILAVIINAAGFGTGIGGAATAVGSFKNLFSSFSGLKLAEGGITTGPTRALIGEGREREAVMPLSKLSSFVNSNGGGNGGTLQTKLQGPNLLIWIDRANKQKGRIG